MGKVVECCEHSNLSDNSGLPIDPNAHQQNYRFSPLLTAITHHITLNQYSAQLFAYLVIVIFCVFPTPRPWSY
jgi:hypothetical protein